MALDVIRLAIDPEAGLAAEARALTAEFEGAAPEEILESALRTHFPGDVALVSSFGADSSVLLHMASRIDPAVPVVFIDTGKLFGETLRYRDALVDRLGLTDVRSIRPQPIRLDTVDPEGTLWFRDTEACCAVRKIEPVSLALDDFGAWITGRKRYQAQTRARLSVFEVDGVKIKVNPLAGWSAADVAAYRSSHDLPAHPLVADGFRSIGCMPCTDRVADGEDDRAGRWRGKAKTECGIHLGLVGREAFGSGI
jgi:phosphoadenosine phosphosulfate reductase